MRRKMIVGNWKMNKTVSEALVFARELLASVDEFPKEALTVVIPPALATYAVSEALINSQFKVGVQNVCWAESGAFTGEISAAMAKAAGAEYAIIGHSERRQMFHEDGEMLNRKLKAVLAAGLTPIFCIGETLAEREEGRVNEILAQQIGEGLNDFTAEEAAKVVIAYEPIWAIGTGKTAAPSDAEAVHSFIRKTLAGKYSAKIADEITLLYGGSVKPSNSAALFAEPDIDGALIGGASLKIADFKAIAASSC